MNDCAYCGRRMSKREEIEQGACNDCVQHLMHTPMLDIRQPGDVQLLCPEHGYIMTLTPEGVERFKAKGQPLCGKCKQPLIYSPALMGGGIAARSMLRHWVIYKHPRDFPRHWVVRTWHLVRDAGEPIHEAVGCLCDSLEEARDSVPPWSYNLGRFDADDPAIFEVWI